MNRIQALTLLTTGTVGLNLLGFITARARTSLQQHDQWSSTFHPEPATMPVSTPVTLPAVPEEATAGYWWARLLSLAGMFGLFAGMLCEVPILVVNSDLLARTLETIFDRFGNPIFVLPLFAWQREITDFDLIAVLISVSQALSASALSLAWEARKRQWAICLLSLVAMVSLISFGTGAAVYRALKIDPNLANALLSGGAALGISAVECIVGVFAIDRFLLPCALAVFWTIATPIRGLARWWRKRQETRALRVRPQRHERPHPVTLALAGLDHVMDALRWLDTAVLAAFRRLGTAVMAIFSRRDHRS